MEFGLMIRDQGTIGDFIMRIITISCEFGSGGRELGKRLADLLGYDYYDKEIILTIAKNKYLSET